MKIFDFLRRALNYTENKIAGGKPKFDRYNQPNLRVGKTVLVADFVMNVRRPDSSRPYVTIGNDCIIGGTFTFESSTGEVLIGDRVYFAGGNVISINKIVFEDDIFVSWGVCFFDNDSHSLDYRHRLLDMQNHLKDWKEGLRNFNTSKDWTHVKSAPIKVCRHSWVGMNCTILKGVTIGEGAIVAAGSVVTSDVEPWTIVGGNPAKFLKRIEVTTRS